MNITRTQLHNFVDVLEQEQLSAAFAALLALVPESAPLPDEPEAMATAEAEFAAGEYFTLDEVLALRPLSAPLASN
jgi:hypothetical protein